MISPTMEVNGSSQILNVSSFIWYNIQHIKSSKKMNTKIIYILVGKCCVPHGQEFMQDSFKPSLSGGINKNFDRSFFFLLL